MLVHIEWNLKVKSEISVCTAILLNNHSNPYRVQVKKFLLKGYIGIA